MKRYEKLAKKLAVLSSSTENGRPSVVAYAINVGPYSICYDKRAMQYSLNYSTHKYFRNTPFTITAYKKYARSCNTLQEALILNIRMLKCAKRLSKYVKLLDKSPQL